MKSFKILIPIILSCIAFSFLETRAQTAAPDGEYISITKTYTLNPYGDWTFRYQHRLKFLTYYAINSLYGETFIVYNPAFQELKINKAITTMADGIIVPSPKNAFNEVLPHYAANFPASNMLREMVITHTGLERGAVTELDYEISKTAGSTLGMMGNEMLQTSSPIDDLKIVIKIPEGRTLHYKLLSIKSEPLMSHEKGFRVYTFTFNNLSALTHDDFQARDQRFIPRLIFSTGKRLSDNLNEIAMQSDFKSAYEGELKRICDSLLKNYPDNFSRIMRAQEIVATEINYYAVPPSLMGFRYRSATETWSSNGGTENEKAILLAAMLRGCCFEADPQAVIPESFYDSETANLLCIEKVLVKVSAPGIDDMLISPLQSDVQDLKFSLGGKVLLPLIPFKTNREQEISNSKNEISLKGEIKLDTHGRLDGSISLELTNALNPAFKLNKDKKYAGKLLSGAYSGTDIKSSKLKTTGSESTEVVFEIVTSDTLKQEAGYYFWKVPLLASGTDGWHMTELPALRNTPLEIPALIHENYSYKIKLPEGMNLVTPEIELSLHQDKVGELKIRIKQEGVELLVTRSIKLDEPVIKPANYAIFRDLMNTWNSKKYREIILRK